MFADLRYHLVSLTAVFLALSVGMLIGGLFLNTAPTETQQRLIRRIQEDLARITAESDRNRRDFERMEQALDAISIEVERIAEAQRFQTKLLANAAEEKGLLVRAIGSEPSESHNKVG